MSKEYLIPENFLNEIENFLSDNKSFISFSRFKKYVSPEFKRWLEERNIPSKFLIYVYKNKLSKIAIPTCPMCGKELTFYQICEGNVYCSAKCSAHSHTVLEKRKHTCKEKYGVSSVSQSDDVKKKKRETSLNHYGVENIFQSKDVKAKIKQTNLKKYGNEQYSQSNNYKERHRAKYWSTFCLRLKEKKIAPLFSKEEYVKDLGRKFKCLCCGAEFFSDGLFFDARYDSYYTLQTHHIYCPYCSRLFSKKEKDVLDFIKMVYDGKIQENVKGLFPNKNMELDIFLPSLNVGIEFDGNYWHSFKDAIERDKRKDEICQQKGIRLFRIKESEWDNNRNTIEEDLKSLILSV